MNRLEPQRRPTGTTRRAALASIGSVVSISLWPHPAARATPDAMRDAITRHLREAGVTGSVPADGRITLEISPLVENGNAVPIRIRVASPMTAADHVRTVALFTDRNPQPEVVVLHFTPHAGRADVETRIRLATSQKLVAIATMNDGRAFEQAVDVIVTLAACLE